MVTQPRLSIGSCDGFSIITPAGLVGWVEEAWIGPSEEPTAFAARLLDGRRGLLIATEIDEIVPEHRSITVGRGVRILELELPHLEPSRGSGEPLTASWRTTGVPLVLPEPPGQLQQAIISLHRPLVPDLGDEKPERAVWQTQPSCCCSPGSRRSR